MREFQLLEHARTKQNIIVLVSLPVTFPSFVGQNLVEYAFSTKFGPLTLTTLKVALRQTLITIYYFFVVMLSQKQ
jgi:hypothetical protein